MRELKKIREEAAMLFKTCLIPLAAELKGGPIEYDEGESKHSNWYDVSSNSVNKSFFHAYQSQNSNDGSVNEKINAVLSTWEKFSDEDKKLIKPLIRKIFELREKYKNKRMLIDDTISDYIYMMY